MNEATLDPRTLDALFSPRSVAVIGASRKRGSIGFAILHNLLMREFHGAVFPVNPHTPVIHSLKCYPTIGAVPDPVDLAVIVVPKALVEGAVDECLAAGVKGLVVITAGFGETGPEGAALELRICRKVRAAGARMIGPNCMGIINADPAVQLDASFAPTAARRGSIGFVSQSGALGVAILNLAEDLGIGLTQFVSMGNKVDVSGNDLLEYWAEDDTTRVIAMYLESFGNPRRFTEIAKRVSRQKPVLVVKSGRTAEGARAATSHTGALAGTDVTVSAFLEQCGVLRVNTIEELFAVALALDRCPPPPGNRVAVVTNAGGPGIMATDACVNLGLAMAELAPQTQDRLRAFLPPEASVANPVDMIASAHAENYRRALKEVLADPGVDMVIAIHVTPQPTRPMDVLDAIAEPARAGVEKPVIAVMMATDDFYDDLKGRDDLPPVYRFPETAARALSVLHRYAAWRNRPVVAPPEPFPVDDREVARLLARTPEGYLPEDDAYRILDLYGIPVARRHLAADPNEAAAAAATVGFPVVLKALVPGLVHKSDAGAVALNLKTPEDVATAAAQMVEALEPTGFLVQRMVRGGPEVIFGLSTDPRFGPLLMFGLGGKYVEVFGDVRFGVTPLDPLDAEEMIRGIRGFPLLEGVRGEPGADLDQLQEILLRLDQLARHHPSIRELDINPFIACADRDAARAVDVRVRVGES